MILPFKLVGQLGSLPVDDGGAAAAAATTSAAAAAAAAHCGGGGSGDDFGCSGGSPWDLLRRS